MSRRILRAESSLLSGWKVARLDRTVTTVECLFERERGKQSMSYFFDLTTFGSGAFGIEACHAMA